MNFRVLLAGLALAGQAMAVSGLADAQTPDSVEEVFAPDHRNGLVMKVEAAIAGAQADLGIVSRAGADEIAAKAGTQYAPLDEIAEEYDIVRHRMVALLNVWRRALGPEARDALHLGVTTVDVYDTVLVLQVLQSIELMLADMRAIEQELACLAIRHRATAMTGRTLGQHALPITFGKKVSVWAAQLRRNIDRLYEVRARLRSSGVLKGAVGSYLGLGPKGIEVEQRVSERLGLAPPEPADWRPARDVFAEYAQTLALIAKSHAAIGGEVFRLQMTDIGELHERRRKRAVGSSTMPQKRNPSLSSALVHHGRTIPAGADVILQDVESSFERDNTSRPNRVMESLTRESAQMLGRTQRLVQRLEIHPERMRANLDSTDGMIMSQRIVLHLAQTMSRETAEARVRAAARRSLSGDVAFGDALRADPVLAPALKGVLTELLDPETYLGLAPQQVDRTLDWIDTRRAERDTESLDRECGAD